MEPYRGFVGRRVIKVRGGGRGRRGLIVEVNLLPGTWWVLFDVTKLAEVVNPYEFEHELDRKETA